LSDGCGGTNASAADLFRYDSNGRVFESSTPGAYFSDNGGGNTTGALYNTNASGEDYGDFSSNCSFVQDATGCLGQSFSITTDGSKPEITILDAVGYNLNTDVAATPEPGSIALLGTGMVSLAGILRRRRRTGPHSQVPLS